jgi:hypothetical protein
MERNPGEREEAWSRNIGLERNSVRGKSLLSLAFSVSLSLSFFFEIFTAAFSVSLFLFLVLSLFSLRTSVSG